MSTAIQPVVTMLYQANAKPGKAEALREALAALITPSRQEAGCITYELYFDKADPNNVVIYEQWVSEEALAQHVQMPHIVQVREKIENLLQGSHEGEFCLLIPVRPGE